MTISEGNDVDLKPYLDNTDDQVLTLSGTELQISAGNSVDFASLFDNLQNQIDANKASADASIAALQNKVDSLEDELDACCSQSTYIEQVGTSTEDEDNPLLFQNEPNPFNDFTTVKYYLPNTVNTASLKIFASNGQLVKELRLDGTGHGSVIIPISMVENGTYLYTLFVDGVTVASKSMITF